MKSTTKTKTATAPSLEDLTGAAALPDAELVARLAEGPYDDDDADCIVSDLKLDRCAWWPAPDRILRAAVEDDRFWSILLAARARVTAARPSAIAATVRPVLDCSTLHVCEATRALLADEPERWTMHGPYGVLVHVPNAGDEGDEERGHPEDLRAVIDRARALGCHFVMLDADGPMVDGLTIYE